MRIFFVILILLLGLLVLDAPITRGIKRDVTDWLLALGSGHGDKSAEDSATPSGEPPPAGPQSVAREAGTAAEDCADSEEKTCDIRHRHSCGPLALEIGPAPDALKRCERVTMVLPQAQVIPLLRRVRCLLVGEDTKVRFNSSNYQPQQGPSDGDTIELRHGSGHLVVFGHYERKDQAAWVAFENIGPGNSVVLKCEAFGPS